MATVCPVFNTNRMVQEYLERFYVPSAERFEKLAGTNLEKAAALARWRRRLQMDWSKIRVEAVDAKGSDPMQVGGHLDVQARVHLGNLSPDDVQVQLFHGPVDNQGEIPAPSTIVMSRDGSAQGSAWIFQGRIPSRSSGHHGYAVRVLPNHPDLGNPFEPGLVCWG
jgi:starch phosphorylase